jgi:hypothetical protein
MGFNVKPGVWTEDSPRTVDVLMNIVLWLVGLTVLNTVLIGMILWMIFRNK